MNTIPSKIIANEFEHSPNLVNYRVKSHRFGNIDGEIKINANQAEINAMKIEQERIDEEMQKKVLLEKGKRKTLENIKNYKNNLRKKEEVDKEKSDLLRMKKEKAKMLNDQLRNKVLSKKVREENKCFEKNENNFNSENKDNNYDDCGEYRDYRDMDRDGNYGNYGNTNKEFETFSFNDNNNEYNEYQEREPTPMSKDSIYQNVNPYYSSNVINLRDDIDKLIKEKLDSVNKIENVKEENVVEEFDRNIENVRDFRKAGLFAKKDDNKNKSVVNNQIMGNKNMNENMNSNMNENMNSNKNELEKRR